MKTTKKTKNPLKNIVNLGKSTVATYKSKDSIKALGEEMGFCMVVLNLNQLSNYVGSKARADAARCFDEIKDEIGDLDIYDFKKEKVINLLDSIKKVSKSLELIIKAHRKTAKFVLSTQSKNIDKFLDMMSDQDKKIPIDKNAIKARLLAAAG